MKYTDGINELKECTALMLRVFGDFNKTLCYFLVKSLDFFDPSTDPKEIYKVCGYMLETIRLRLYQMSSNDSSITAEQLKEEWSCLELRPLTDDINIEKYQAYKKAVLQGLVNRENKQEVKTEK